MHWALFTWDLAFDVIFRLLYFFRFFICTQLCAQCNLKCYRFVDLIKRFVLRAFYYNYRFLQLLERFRSKCMIPFVCLPMAARLNSTQLSLSQTPQQHTPRTIYWRTDWRLKTKCQRKYFLYEISGPLIDYER